MNKLKKQQLVQTNPKKKGGRYSLENTKERRDQVFKLHFDDEKSNREIAKIMNINPKTINADMHEILKGISRTFSQNNYPQLVLEQLLRFQQKRKEIKEKFNDNMEISDYIKLSQFQLIIEDKIQSIINHIQDQNITITDKKRIKNHKVKTFIIDMVNHFLKWEIFDLDFKTFLDDYNKLDEDEKILLKEKLNILGLTTQTDPSHSSYSAYTFSSSYNLLNIVFESGVFSKEESEKISKIIDEHQNEELDENVLDCVKRGEPHPIIEYTKDFIIKSDIKTVEEYEEIVIKDRLETGIMSKEQAEDFTCHEYVKLLIKKMNHIQTA